MDFSRIPVENNIGYLFGLHQFAKIIGSLCKWLGIADQSFFSFPERNVTLIKKPPARFYGPDLLDVGSALRKKAHVDPEEREIRAYFRLQVLCQLSRSTCVAAFK